MDLADLQKEVEFYHSICWSDNTKRSYSSHRRSYLTFCFHAKLTPIPATSRTLCLYAAHLARRLKYSSVKQYLNIIRVLHLEWNLPNPLLNNFNLQSVLRGIRRHLGNRVMRKEPITPALLLTLLSHLDITSPFGANVWAAALLMFFGLLRKSNVLPASPGAFNPTLHLRRRDLTFTNKGLQVLIRWSKTNQFQERQQVLPLPRITGSKLCPSQAVFHALDLTRGAPLDGPALVLPHGCHHRPLTAPTFVAEIKQKLSEHCDTSRIAGHSFRRGGACWAYSSGVPVDLIRQLGDWKSNSYTLYTLCDVNLLSNAMSTMASTLPKQ